MLTLTKTLTLGFCDGASGSPLTVRACKMLLCFVCNVQCVFCPSGDSKRFEILQLLNLTTTADETCSRENGSCLQCVLGCIYSGSKFLCTDFMRNSPHLLWEATAVNRFSADTFVSTLTLEQPLQGGGVDWWRFRWKLKKKYEVSSHFSPFAWSGHVKFCYSPKSQSHPGGFYGQT